MYGDKNAVVTHDVVHGRLERGRRACAAPCALDVAMDVAYMSRFLVLLLLVLINVEES